MVLKRSIGERIFEVFNITLMIFIMIITLYPFYYVVLGSVSNSNLLIAHTGLLLVPQGFSLDAYKVVLKHPMIATGYYNTFIYVTVGTFLNIIMTSLGAYALSKKSFYWKKLIMMAIVFTMFFRGGMIPSFLVVLKLGMMNTRAAIIIPGLINTWNLIIMRTYFQSIPDSLEESAYIDGANDFLILFRIVLPLSLPIVAVMILYYGVGHWNSWFSAMLYLKNKELHPLQLVLREILLANVTDPMLGDMLAGERMEIAETIKYATIIVATLPILIVYPFLQKYFVKGMMIGALKG